MKPKEYLHQAYRLDKRIQSNIEEMDRLREMSVSVSSPRYDREPVKTSGSNDAPFVKCVERIIDLEEKINREIDTLVALKEQIREVISRVTDTDEQMVLRYRYVHNYTWEHIGDELHADKSTVRRWHSSALAHVKMPDNPITI